jgi:superfamily II DNA or RNA helicase
MIVSGFQNKNPAGGGNHQAGQSQYTRIIIMKFELKNKAILQGLRSDTANVVRQRLTMPNPAYADAEKMGRWTGNIEPELRFYEDIPGGLICPRAAAAKLYILCQQHREAIEVADNRLELDPVEFTFNGTLRPYQQDVVTNVLERDHGTLSAPTGSGKTCMGLFIIAQRKQPALIVVHTKELLTQWVVAIEKFLGIPANQVGIIGNGKFSIGDQITVALIQTLYRRLDDVTPHIGHLVIDECHRTPSRVFTQAVDAFDARYRLGLTATPWRRDKLSKVIFWYVGDVTGQVEKQDLLDNGNLCQAAAVFIPTGFTPVLDPSDYYSNALSELTQDIDRNRLVARTVKEHNGTGITLILSDRREHCNTLADILKQDQGIQPAVLTGQTPAKAREKIIQDLQSGECHYLVATGQLIGEGFDLPEIGTLALATPVKFSGRLIQYIGRALRPAPGKDKAIILDFVDKHPVFEHSARSRWGTYTQQGIKVKGA